MDIKTVLFDLGGVLIEVISAKRLSELIGNRMTFDDVSKRWTQSKYLNLYESGQCDKTTFITGVIKELDMDISPEAFEAEFKQFLKGFYPGAIELMQLIPFEYTLACLTDTNETQWHDLCRRTSVDTYFQHRFLSYKIGQVKPNGQVYQYVIEGLRCCPNEIAYFGDNEANVQAGLKAGMNAYKTTGVQDLKDKLKKMKII